MYRPPNKKQDGGDFKDVLLDGTTIHVSQETMNLVSEMAHISSFAQMSSFINFHSLTPVQVSQLLDSLGTALSNENVIIHDNKSTIEGIKTMISQPNTGLQAIYDSTIVSYSTSVLNYYSSVNSLCTSMYLISTYTSSISSLMILDDYELSTISSLYYNYSSIMVNIQHKLDTLASQTSTYYSLSTTYGMYATNYSTFYPQYSAESSALGTDIVSLNHAYGIYITSLNSNDLSTVKSLSTIYTNDLSTMYVLSSIVNGSLYNLSMLGPYIQSTLSCINTLSVVSTGYNSPELDEYYSRLMISTISTIDGYNHRKKDLQSTIQVYRGQYGVAGDIAQSEYIILKGQTSTFYGKALIAVQNTLLSYKYQIEEWSAFIGFIVTQLLIQKSYVALQINGISIASNPILPTKSLTDLNVLETSLQSIVNVLDTLDLNFNEILNICSNEMSERRNYISARQNATDLEGSVLMKISTYTDVYQLYSGYMRQLTTSATNINSYQSQRLTATATIMTIVNPQLSAIRNLIRKGVINFSYTIPDSVSTDNTPFAIDPTIYQILPQLGSTDSSTTTSKSN